MPLYYHYAHNTRSICGILLPCCKITSRNSYGARWHGRSGALNHGVNWYDTGPDVDASRSLSCYQCVIVVKFPNRLRTAGRVRRGDRVEA